MGLQKLELGYNSLGLHSCETLAKLLVEVEEAPGEWTHRDSVLTSVACAVPDGLVGWGGGCFGK